MKKLKTSRVITVLACSGRVLRLLEHCRVRKMIELDSIPTVLHVPKNSIGNKILVGFSDGRVALFRINPMIMEGMSCACICIIESLCAFIENFAKIVYFQ